MRVSFPEQDNSRGPRITSPNQKAVDLINRSYFHRSFREMMLLSSPEFNGDSGFVEFVSPTSKITIVKEKLEGVESISIYREETHFRTPIFAGERLKDGEGLKVDVKKNAKYVIEFHRDGNYPSDKRSSGVLSVICWKD